MLTASSARPTPRWSPSPPWPTAGASRTSDLLAGRASHVAAAAAGYHQALILGAILMAAAALIALRIGNTRQTGPTVMVDTDPAAGHEPAASR